MTSARKAVSKRPADAYQCRTCRFELWLPVAAMRVSHVGLYDDARFPGRCLLALDDHYDELFELRPKLMSLYLADLADLAAAIREVTGAARVNYAMLGNAVSHVHWHVVPRQPNAEPLPHDAPWSDPREVSPMPVRQRDVIRTRLAAELVRQSDLPLGPATSADTARRAHG